MLRRLPPVLLLVAVLTSPAFAAEELRVSPLKDGEAVRVDGVMDKEVTSTVM